MDTLFMISLLILLYLTVKICLFLWYMIRCYVLTKFGFVVNLRKFGTWAVITGATDGIGKAYAEELAKLGFRILLISRNKEKLENVSKYIMKTYDVQTKHIVFDFSSTSGYEKIREVVNQLDVGILINNVGTDGVCDEFFDRIDINNICETAYTNIFSELNMTHIVLEGMVSRKRGVVVHISSVFGYLPTPLMNIYPETKAFVNSFAKALQLENEACENIHHQLVTPCFVATNMSGMTPKGYFVPSAKTFVSSAVKTIGITTNTFGYWAHDLLGLLINICSYEILEKIFFGNICRIRLKKRFVYK